MSICVAKLITCARQLLFVSNQDHQVLGQVEPTHLSFLFFESYSLPVATFSHTANSVIMVLLLLALSQVTWPTLMSFMMVDNWISMTVRRTITLPYLPYAQFRLV